MSRRTQRPREHLYSGPLTSEHAEWAQGTDEGEGMTQANDYDSFAEAYSADNETNLVNGHYERPAMLDLAGDVRDRRILDVGCGPGRRRR